MINVSRSSIAAFSLFVIVVLLSVGAYQVSVSGPCYEVETLATDEEAVEDLRVELTRFVNSREGREELIEISGLSVRMQELPAQFRSVFFDLDINSSHLLLKINQSSSSNYRPSNITAIGVGYARAGLMFPVVDYFKVVRRYDPITLGQDYVLECTD